MIEQTLKTLIENATGKSLFVLEKPNGNNQCVVYKRISTKPTRTQTGKGNLYKARFQFDCYSERFEDCRKIALDLMELDCYKGSEIRLITVENDFYVKELDSGIYRNIVELFVWFVG